MKNETKIIIGAIVVILVLLVGAYALSGSNSPQPTATPTVMPVTATPTAVPGESTATATPVPSVAPVSTVTPTPAPESGVKQTEFGYWITYPPLGPQNWSSPNLPPDAGSQPQNNTVYFDPAYRHWDLGFYYPGCGLYSESTVVHRVGDLNGTTIVNVHIEASENMWTVNSLMAWYYLSDNVDYINDTDFTVTFHPGESAETITINSWGIEQPGLPTPSEGAFEATVQMTIVAVDDGYTIGSNDVFMLDIDQHVVAIPQVYFEHPSCYLYNNSGSVGVGGYVQGYSNNGNLVSLYMWMARNDSSGDLPVVIAPDTDLPAGSYTIHPFSFTDGNVLGILTVDIDRQYVLGGEYYYLTLNIEGSPGYTIGSNYDHFDIDINAQQ